MIDQNTFYLILLGLFAVCMGSFLNVVIYRLPLILNNQWIKDCEALTGATDQPQKPLGLALPLSFCPQCQTPIKPWHNIPILSFFLVKRRCPDCQQKISWRYPLVEMVTTVLAVLIGLHFGFNSQGFFALAFLFLIIPQFFIDLEHQILPDVLTYGLLWTGLIANTQGLFAPLDEAVWGAVIGYLALYLLLKIYALVRGKIGMGHGDFKCFAALGAWFGLRQLPFILFFASVTGAVAGLLYLIIKKKSKDTAIPFGPFLVLSGLVVLLYAQL